MHGLHVVRLTWPQILCGMNRWFWYTLKREWKEHRRRVESCSQ